MDYDANLSAACPIEIVQEVRASDLSQYATNDIRSDVEWSDFPDASKCATVIVQYFTPKIGADTDVSQINHWLIGLRSHYKNFPNEIHQDVYDALVRLSYRPEIMGDHAIAWLASIYFRTLVDLNIDIRGKMAGPAILNWNAAPEPRHLRPAWHYTRYLAFFNTPGAYDELARRIEDQSVLGDVDRMYKMCLGLRDLDTPEARAIMKQYEDDPRLRYFPHFDPTSLGSSIRQLLRSRMNPRRGVY